VVGDRTNRGGSHAQFVFGIDRGFVIEGKAHGHEGSDGRYPVRATWYPGQARDIVSPLPWAWLLRHTALGGTVQAVHFETVTRTLPNFLTSFPFFFPC